MQPRRLRLGDILDDYCPRERRLTNHAVVAMIDDQVKQTRCTTCDAEHEYKDGKAPAPRRKKGGGADLFEGGPDPRPVLTNAVAHPQRPENGAGHPPPELAPSSAPFAPPVAASAPDDLEEPVELSAAPEPLEPPSEADADADPDLDSDDGVRDDDGPVHRRLIRATLPRPEGQVPERKAPDFTFRPAGGRFSQTRNGNGPVNRGHRQARAGQPQSGGGQSARFGSGRPQGTGHGASQGQRPGNRSGQNASQRGTGRPAGQPRGQRQGGQGRKRGR